jgi:hypothetical protein
MDTDNTSYQHKDFSAVKIRKKIHRISDKSLTVVLSPHQQYVARLNKALIDLDDERVRQSMQHEHKISELNDEYSYIYWLLEDAKAEEKRLRAEHSSENQSQKKALEKVGTPNSNANLRTPSSVKCEEIEH